MSLPSGKLGCRGELLAQQQLSDSELWEKLCQQPETLFFSRLNVLESIKVQPTETEFRWWR